MKAVHSFAARINLVIFGVPWTAYYFPSSSAHIAKIFKSKIPKGSEKGKAKGPIDKHFDKALVQLSEYYDLKNDFTEAIDTVDLSLATVKVPVYIDASHIADFFDGEGDATEREVNLPNSGGKKFKVKLEDFAGTQVEFSALVPDPQEADPLDAATIARKKALLIWYLEKKGTRQQVPAVLQDFYAEPVRDPAADNDDGRLINTWRVTPINLNAWTLLYTEYKTSLETLNNYNSLPAYLKSCIGTRITGTENWAVPLAETADVRVVVTGAQSNRLIFFTYKEKIITEWKWLVKFDLRLSRHVTEREYSDAYKKIKDTWIKCRTQYYKTDSVYPKNISWEEWLGSNVSKFDFFYTHQVGTGSPYFLEDAANKKNEGKLEENRNKLETEFINNATKKDKTNAGFIKNELKIETYKNGSTNKNPPIVGGVEFIYKHDFNSRQRAVLSKLYKDHEEFQEQLPLHDDMRDAKGNWKYPTLEERVLQELSNFAGS